MQEIGRFSVIQGMETCSKAKKILATFPPDIRGYFEKLDRRCQKHGITLLLGSGKALYSDGRCGGYFCNHIKVLAVAIGGEIGDVLNCAIHEEMHLSQALNPRSIWHKKGILTGHSRFFKHLSGERIYKPRQAVLAAISLEADCERRTLRALKKWQKYVNLKLAARKATAYVMAHWWMLETGKWPKKSPYNKKILAHCPDTLVRSNSKPSWRLKMAFDRYL